MLAQTLGGQLVNLIGFIVLGWLLFEEDFGLYALTVTIGAAAGLIQRTGLVTILVRRYRKFDRWANAALWMSLVLGLVSAALMVVAAPIGERLYGEEGLAGLILVLALSVPLNAVCAVPEARLQAQLRFRLLATLRFAWLAGTMALTILFALLEFGAYSFVLPRPIMQAGRLAVLWWITRPRIRWSLHLRRWRYMLTDVVMLTTFNVSVFVQNQCDYVLLGLFHTDRIVGVYYFAFGLSQRAVSMLTINLRDVLFPALSSIQDDPARQLAAFLRASRLLALMGAPACLLQAALAEPGISAFLPTRWEGAVPVLQVLSLGAVFRLLGLPAFALIRAQGRFRTLVVLSIAVGVLFIACVTVGAIVGEAKAVAVAVALFMAVTGPVEMYVAILPGGGRWRDVWKVFAAPLALGAAAVGAAWLVGNALPAMPGRDWTLLVLIPLISGALYVPLIRWAAPEDGHDLTERFKDLLLRRRST
jgi:PST family polysaccharide transporter